MSLTQSKAARALSWSLSIARECHEGKGHTNGLICDDLPLSPDPVPAPPAQASPAQPSPGLRGRKRLVRPKWVMNDPPQENGSGSGLSAPPPQIQTRSHHELSRSLALNPPRHTPLSSPSVSYRINFSRISIYI